MLHAHTRATTECVRAFPLFPFAESANGMLLNAHARTHPSPHFFCQASIPSLVENFSLTAPILLGRIPLAFPNAAAHQAVRYVQAWAVQNKPRIGSPLTDNRENPWESGRKNG